MLLFYIYNVCSLWIFEIPPSTQTIKQLTNTLPFKGGSQADPGTSRPGKEQQKIVLILGIPKKQGGNKIGDFICPSPNC